MRIGFNAHFIQQPATGSGQYARNLLAALADLDNGDEYILISPSSAARLASKLDECHSAQGGLARGSDPFYLHTGQVNPQGGALPRQLAKIWFEQVSMPRAGHRASVDLIHYPYFAAPLLGGRSVVVTIHDVIPLLLGPYRGTLAVHMYSLLVSVAARRAAAIITDSKSSRDDIVRLLRIPPERITIIYLAVDTSFASKEDARTEKSTAEQVRHKYGLPDEFILYIGGLDYRKNVVALVEAFAEARKQLRTKHWLAIAGQPPDGSSGRALDISPLFPDLKGAVRRLGIEEEVLFLGTVADEDRPYLYRAAKVFVYPSLYEGFGLPPLEALACGTPIICSNSSSLPEVVGDAAVLFSPADRAELTRALVHVLSDATLRAELKCRGLERSRKFSWHKTALETVGVYRSIVGKAASPPTISLGDRL